MNQRQGGFGAGVGAIVAIAIGVDVGMMAVVGYALGIVVDDVGRVVRDRLQDVGAGPVDETTAAHAAYVDGEIDEDELERRLFLAEDPRASVVVEAVSAVDGVGDRRAAALAERFASAEDVAAADLEELVDVEHVGEATAKRLHEQLR